MAGSSGTGVLQFLLHHAEAFEVQGTNGRECVRLRAAATAGASDPNQRREAELANTWIPQQQSSAASRAGAARACTGAPLHAALHGALHGAPSANAVAAPTRLTTGMSVTSVTSAPQGIAAPPTVPVPVPVPVPVVSGVVSSGGGGGGGGGLVQQIDRIKATLELPAGLSVKQALREANVMMGTVYDEATPLPQAAARMLQQLGI